VQSACDTHGQGFMWVWRARRSLARRMRGCTVHDSCADRAATYPRLACERVRYRYPRPTHEMQSQPDAPNSAGNRAWGWMVAIFAIVVLLVLVLALWSEREDSLRLPAEELERRQEQPWEPEPIDSPAIP
jgi:hypothetical protein